ncbi:MAG: helicase-exonuclease AddAB subunit AddA [Phycisphaerales bacterium]|nr:helicase-exonuclease AddAB subunit AddA [Phycisphaerales bacterium]MCB9857719.1 helicase-exonuclease AddAB subunit AddA [Phycisphaerales bacterium]
MKQWTSDQKRAIEAIDRSVLVSAAAGSGKTAVLAERCAYLVTDAPSPCRIDELLVVTFTDAAAAEMRERIARALRERQHREPWNNRIRRQLALLDGAQISTIHSFCRNLLNRYFAFVDLEPRMPMLAPLEAVQLRKQCAKETFDALAAEDAQNAAAFLDFISAYGSHEPSLRGRVLDIAAFLESHDHPDAWLASARGRFNHADPTKLSKNWQSELADWLARELDQLAAAAQTLHASVPRGEIGGWFMPVFDAFLRFADGAIARLDRIKDVAMIDSICRDELPALDLPKIAVSRRTNQYKALSDEDKAIYELCDNARKELEKALKRVNDRVGRFSCADWAAGIAATAPHVEMLLTAVEHVRNAYREAKRDLGVLDFSDLERYTLNLLRDEEHHVAERLHARFRHVLVDEFQDINPIQAEILRLVSTEAAPERPNNLFTVGDVKQSIYRFRLGEPALFIARHDRFKSTDQDAGRVVPLSMNFRSERPIIDAINAIFERLMSRDLGGIDYDGDARLVPFHTAPLPDGAVPCEIHLLQDPQTVSASEADSSDASEEGAAGDWERIEREAYVIAERIKELHADGVGFGEIVILMRSMKARIGLFLRRLLEQGVPAVSTMSGDLFDAMEVLDVLGLLQLLDNEQQDIPLAALLRSPMMGEPLTDSQLVEIRTCKAIGNGPRPFHEAVRNYAAHGPDQGLRSQLASMFDRLSSWRTIASRRPIADVLWQIYEESGYLAYVSALPRGEQRRANLIQLHEYARQFGDFRRQGLNQFIRFIDELRESGEELMAGAVAPQGDAVRIMTIHASKGLEFRAVILAEAGKLFNLQDAQNAVLVDRKLGVGLEGVDLERHFQYPTLPHRLVGDAVRRQSIAEELRVLYVALTRAKERLLIVGTEKLVEPPGPTVGDPGTKAAALPLPVRLNARNCMKWIIAAMETMPAESVAWDGAEPGDETLFHVRQYSLDDMRDWAFESPASDAAARKAEQFAALVPLGSVAPTDVGLIATIERRICTPYSADALTHVPAVVAASELKRRWNLLEEPDDPAVAMPTGKPKAKYPRQFRMPAITGAAAAPATTQIGTWTHELLQRIDLAQPCDRANIEQQLTGMVAARHFTSEQAQAIDLDAVTWFFASDLGQRLRNPATRVLREWPFVLAADPRRYRPEAAPQDADDLLLVRGIVDCLFDDGAGWEVLDYKTDRVTGDALHERAREYAGQVQIYAQAVEAAFNVRPKKTWLAFMTPHEIVSV